MQSIDHHLARALADMERVILWGAGQLTMKLLALPSLSRIQVQAIVDSNPTLRGKKLRGAPVIGPQEISGTTESSAIVIATLLHAEEIMTQIRAMGLRNPVLQLLPNSNREANRS
jgi:FlaA1/EpsC-like NDP-sugar epimerase